METWGLWILLSVATNSVLSRKITFPRIEDDFPTNCTLPDGVQGFCSKQCPEMQKKSNDLKVCYFLKDELYSCCRKFTVPLERIEDRPSVQACNKPPRFEIVHGIRTAPREFPHMAALGWKSPFDISTPYEYKCGGVFISFNYVLTAAHCAEVNGVEPVVVLAGGIDLTDNTTQPMKISRIIVHPDYDPNTVYNDIALLQVQNSIGYNDPACIWTSWEPNGDVVAIGYGHTLFAGSSSNHLLKAYLKIMPIQECQSYYEVDDRLPKGIQNTQLCARDPKQFRDTCQGDSGGPIAVEIQNFYGMLRPHIVGITSFGQGCAFSPPGVYTRVSSYIDWIENIVWPKQ